MNQVIDVIKHPADIRNLVNQVAHVATDPAGVNKLMKQVVDVVKYPASKLLNQVVDVIKHPNERPDIADILHHLVPVKGAGVANDQVSENDANCDDVEIDDGEIDGEWREPDAKVPRIEDSECFDDFQRADDHTPARIPSTGKRKYAQRTCAACRRNGIRRDTCHYCKMCPDNPALCKDCFREYHM